MVANRWPKEMPHLTKADFHHRSWAKPATAKDKRAAASLPPDAWDHGPMLPDYATPKQLEAVGCGTRCCLVGWVRHSFGLPASPGLGGPLPPQGEKFLRKFCDVANRPLDKDEFGEELEYDASDAFEGYLGWHGKGPITPTQATKAWSATLAHFGYTETA